MKKRRWIGILLFLFLFTSLVTMASEPNEGPIDESAVLRTGNLTMLERKEIILTEELLYITLDGDFAHIYAYYQLLNPGVETEVTVGFPVDFLSDSDIYGLAWQEECFPYHRMSDESGSLAVQSYTDEKPQMVIVDGRKRDLVRKWYVAELKLEANSHKELVVEYAVRCSLLDMDSVATFFPIFSDRLLTYCFSPAGGWGNDLIRNFRVVVDARANLERGGKLKSLNFTSFNSYGGLYIYESENFNLQELYELKILYNNTAALMTEFISTYQIRQEQIASLASASEDPAFPLIQLFDGDLRTAWVVGGRTRSGAGKTTGEDWIEVELKDFCLQAVGIVNGFLEDETAYAAFNRVKKVKIEIEQDEYDFFADRVARKHIEKIVEIADRPYQPINQAVFAPLVSIVTDLGQSFNKTYRVRLTILETYPGSEGRTALGELFLLGYKNDQIFP